MFSLFIRLKIVTSRLRCHRRAVLVEVWLLIAGTLWDFVRSCMSGRVISRRPGFVLEKNC